MSFFDDSLTVCFCGGRGGGKTITGADFCRRAMLEGRRVYSNVDIAFRYQVDTKSPIYTLKSLPIEMDALISLSDEMRSVIVFIDEVNLWADSHQWQSLRAQILEAISQEQRKRKLSFLFTVQDFSWITPRMRFQTDLRIESTDLSYQYPGMERGVFFKQTWFDLSGKLCGVAFRPETYDKSVRQVTFFGKPDWDIYNTMNEFGHNSITTTIRVQKDVILYNSQGQRIEGGSKSDFMPILKGMRDSLKNSGVLSLTSAQMSQALERTGLDSDLQKMGRYLTMAGYAKHSTKRGGVYELAV